MAVKYHYTRDLMKQGDVELSYQLTDQIIANGLTKPLGPILFKKFVTSLGMSSVAEETPDEHSNIGEHQLTREHTFARHGEHSTGGHSTIVTSVLRLTCRH